ncbi:Zn-ribbon domain-containing OB-fold protein [Rhodococcus oxybenzonivorans]|uniref:Zn-ribbon domain-containing OB-fold protein n=1 Tax=Rhodococcus oxybenzonivorans TaxID=1990687 RepID=UPI00295409C8|nr:Zn-ribbon domain-containing OB-fold protein [Rhodococcus oxybenzonivorans]MDV7352746.1 Zn-ribbon domain-containing OB-fold protein [Rhodococcus oxybenzonivorans]
MTEKTANEKKAAPEKPRADLPTVEDATAPYWDAAKQGKLLIALCGSCGKVHHYPRPFCPFCWSEDVSAVEATGRGTLYTYSTIYVNDLHPFKTRLPYVAALVELEEGPRVMTNIEGCEPDQLEVGMAVEVAFRPLTDELDATVFRPAGAVAG